MNVNPSMFCEYDIRGRYPRKVNDAVAAAIARAFVAVIGGNVRSSGHQIFL